MREIRDSGEDERKTEGGKRETEVREIEITEIEREWDEMKMGDKDHTVNRFMLNTRQRQNNE